MKTEQHIPKVVSDILKERNVSRDEILYIASADMNPDYGFQRFYLLLQQEQLIFLVMEPQAGQTFSAFYQGQGEKMAEIHFFALSRLAKPLLTAQVVGGILSMEIDGAERQLCAYSNSCLREMAKLRDLLDKRLKGEELTAADFTEDSHPPFCPKCGLVYPDRDRRVCPKCMDKRSIFFRVLSYFTEYKLRLLVIFICILFTAAANVFAPILTGSIFYDKVLAKDPAYAASLGLDGSNYGAVLLLTVLIYVSIRVFQQAVGIIQGRSVAHFVPRAVFNIKTKIFNSMQRLSIGYFTKKQTGGLMTRILNDSNEVMYFFIDGLPFLLSNTLIIIASTVIMLTINWQLALMTLLFVAGLFVVSFRMMPMLWNYYGKRHRSVRTMNAQINDNLTGARVVRAFGQESSEIKRFDKVNNRVKNIQLDLGIYDLRFSILYWAFNDIASVVIWVAGSFYALQRPDFSIGTLLTFVGYCSMLNGPMTFMSFVFRWWSNSMNSAQRIFEIIDAVPDVVEKPDAVRLENLRGEIRLEKVSFAYEPNKNVLSDISFSVGAGEMLGIVGHSGAGKSTLVNLISRLYDPGQGEIFLDGVNVRDISFADLRRNIAMVSQESYVFIGTVADNIAYARPEATKEEIIAAARAASAHDFISKLPDGYDTVIGAGRRNLSGGERQRLSIARAIIANPRILILDEATASVDTETEKSIQAALDLLIKGRTTISIAHRLSTLRNADKLVVIENGKITEEGTHMELAVKKGTYYKLMQLQSKALAMRGVGD